MLQKLNRITMLNLGHSISITAAAFKQYSTLPLNPYANPTEPLTKPQLKPLVPSQYSHGNFSKLVQNVIALPSVLLTACQNLTSPGNTTPETAQSLPHFLDSFSKHFSIIEMSGEIRENQFDIESCCVKMTQSRDKGEPLVLPNLKLKVLIEAIRMVLEIVYDERFVTFSYGGRVGMGRHTAIRLKRLFECVVRIERGGCYLGRGFPQCSILINICFGSLDKEIQEMRLKMNQNNPKVDSRSKMSILALKNQILKFLEVNSDLKVDRLKTAVHSAVSEKINFLGMELQAVSPTVLHPSVRESN
ncbi:hypothetical protein SLEP1_g56033 [Rubroshorea leprosula]|uniref:Uncharacterized protein n=1 Tax=Rubroshorea leprosula TaxID=152421 RepID=A0AAV5MIG0_9ROSI|nr:hypothetical protein SLEP1_g56033 [Rubroshorea leprosula]